VARAAEDLLQPVDGDVLDLGGGRAGAPAGDVDVEGGAEHAADGADRRAGGRDVAEEAGMGVVAAVLDDGGVELVEEGVEGGGIPGEGLGETVAEGAGGSGDDGRPRSQGVIVSRDAVEGGVGEGAKVGEKGVGHEATGYQAAGEGE